MRGTKIEWCTATWNPVTGCKHGCEYCYARRIAVRFRKTLPYRNMGELDDKQYYEDKRGITRQSMYPYGFRPTFHKYRLDEPQNWKKPQDIFVCSMADLFGDWVPDYWIEKVFEACSKAEQHNYLFLTKNPQRYFDLGCHDRLPEKPNMWYGSSWTEPQNWLFSKANLGDKKLNIFASVEPLLDKPGNLEAYLKPGMVDWVIIGAETGNRKNKVVPKKEWVDEICGYADKANIPVFMKDNLVPILGEINMRRELPPGFHSHNIRG